MSAPRILIAGVGNIFRGDDAFGGEVVRRLAGRGLPAGVRVCDFGTRGHDLAYAILDGYDGVILVDAAARGGPPGTLYTIELAPRPLAEPAPLGTHGVDLPAVFAMVRALGGTRARLYLVGCEPADLGPDDEGRMGLSEPVAAALGPAVAFVEAVAAGLVTGATVGAERA
ncbi:hydrogenase maturation protease [Frigoriglobus tundricola]|uniref:Hydrogenase maturation protease n=1 Tax=Frigoriglobus tundricola TaxID=2774151 RepID=A0A6M5YNK7_9BACT|nr:hydrogenase maturation protease [Frigoriglobus tundricola]QJW94950.1 Hydrogenase maturation protease [Frigoriglobus tundricola]